MQGVWRESMGEINMKKISCHELMQRDELQRLQDKFCQVFGIFMYCLDEEGHRITEISGELQKAEYLQECVQKSVIIRVLDQVGQESGKEIAVLDSGLKGVKVAAVSVKEGGRAVVRWIVFSMPAHRDGREAEGLSESVTHDGSIQFSGALELLKEVTEGLLQGKRKLDDALEESRRSRFGEAQMDRRLKLAEASAEAVQLLVSDEPVNNIMVRLLMGMGEYLGVCKAVVLKVYDDGCAMDVLAEWCKQGGAVPFDHNEKVPPFDFLDEEKPVLFSKGEAGHGATASFPVLVQKNTGSIFLHLAFSGQEHLWTEEEEAYIGNCAKALGQIFTRRIQQNSIAGSFEVLESILDHVGCSIYVQDAKSKEALFANSMLKDTFADELRRGSFDSLIQQGMWLKKSDEACEIYHANKDRWYDMFSTEIFWVDGRRVRLCSLYDITDKKSYQKRIEQQAYTDFLTGLYNRMCCERDLTWHIEEAKKKNALGCILYLDLDDFKHINDGLGHQYGDELLKSISHSLQRIDGIRNTCYRMGGDEFVVIIPPKFYDNYERIVEDIRLIFNKPWYLKDADYYCTMSMGVVTFPESGESVTELIKKADIAMYEAKKGGKNRLARYSDNFDTSSGRRLDMEKNMRDATAAGYQEFEVYYQPIIDVQAEGMQCIGAEALIRWNSANLGFIPPSEFIPLAEYLGLINPIGNYVLVEACRSCRYWNEHGYSEYKVNVNLSVVQLLQPDIVDSVGSIIRETGIDPANLTLEVTESLAINDMERMKEILCSIKCLGVMIALDDFGTGYSSLNHIREIPFDMIKVDQSFVKDLAGDAYSQSFIKMVAELAETIGVCICVEGIETTDQINVLQGMKVRFIQGFFFDRPMAKGEFEKKYLSGLANGFETV